MLAGKRSSRILAAVSFIFVTQKVVQSAFETLKKPDEQDRPLKFKKHV